MTNYNEFFERLTPVFYDADEHAREKTAAHQKELDQLHYLGNKYDMTAPDVVLLCQLAQINVDELMNHTGATA